jgi:hypothetical protein
MDSLQDFVAKYATMRNIIILVIVILVIIFIYRARGSAGKSGKAARKQASVAPGDTGGSTGATTAATSSTAADDVFASLVESGVVSTSAPASEGNAHTGVMMPDSESADM